MKKMLTAITAAMLAAAVLTGCGDKKKDTITAKDGTVIWEGAKGDYKLPKELSDSIFDYRVMLDGNVLTVPVTMRHYQDAGWTAPEGTAFSAGYSGSFDIKKDDCMATVEAINRYDTLAECSDNENGAPRIDVFRVRVTTKWNEKPFLLPKGIEARRSTMDDVKSAYGEPQEIEDVYKAGGGDRKGFTYYYYDDSSLASHKDSERYIAITFEKNDEKDKDAPYVVQTVVLYRG